MKFRTDFVTNSSSSGYVAIIVYLKNGNQFFFETEYHSGYGGYFWNGDDFEKAFRRASTGADVLQAIKDNSNKDDGFIINELMNDRNHFIDKLSAIKSVEDIDKISMSEDTYWDVRGGDEDVNWVLNYKFN